MNNKKIIIPDKNTTEKLKKLENFLKEDKLESQDFYKYFKGKKAKYNIPVPSLEKCINDFVKYDDNNKFDLRIILSLVQLADRNLFIDISKFVSERYENKPASDLTLKQFKASLTRRLFQLGF